MTVPSEGRGGYFYDLGDGNAIHESELTPEQRKTLGLPEPEATPAPTPVPMTEEPSNA